MSDIIQVKNLKVDFKTDDGLVHAVKDINFNIPKGQTVGLVGESGSGKSVTALAIMRLIASPPGTISGGEIFFCNEDLLKKTKNEIRKIRGKKISMIFQEPMTSLNPVFTVGDQISESLILHEGLSKTEAWEQSIELLHKVGIPNPSQRISSYPHEMSGGQRQRVMIAMAIACSPELLIADEPTTALDVTIQKQILELIDELQDQSDMSVLFITHDLGVIADIADEVIVMYKGEIVEKNLTEAVFEHPQHPYTKGLLACRPSLISNPPRLPMVSDFMTSEGQEIPNSFDIKKIEKHTRPIDEVKNPVILEIKNLDKKFPIKKNFFGKTTEWLNAVSDVSLKVRKGRTLGLVGESGCGKTTLGRALLRLIEPTSGDITYNGVKLNDLNHSKMRDMRRKLQIIFQDPYASLNPRMTIGSAIMEPMAIHKLYNSRAERREKSG